MQLRTFAFILLILVVIAAGASNAQASTATIKLNLLETTGLQEGPIELVDGGQGCEGTRLRILEIENGTVTISIGATALITGIGPAELKSSERGCKTEQSARVSTRRVEYAKTQECTGKKRLEYNVSLKVDDAGFEFVKVNKAGGEVTANLACKYKFL